MPAFTPDRLIRAQVALGDIALAPGGELAVYTRRICTGDAGYRTHLFTVPWRSGRARQLTRGAVEDSAPAFDPAGRRRLAFLRGGQVWAIDLDGGEAEQLTKHAHGVSGFAWSPDGKRLLLLASAPETRFAVGPIEDDKPPLARRFDRIDWRLDGVGWLDRHTHLWVVVARAGGRPRRLVSGDYSVESACWSPDGRSICFAADSSPDADVSRADRLFAIDAAGGDAREVCRLGGGCSSPRWSPDGRLIALRGNGEDGAPWASPESIWVVAATGGTPRDLGAGRHLSVRAATGNDLEDWQNELGQELAWQGSEAVLSTVTDRRQSGVWRFPLAGEPAPLAHVEPHVYRYAADARGERVLTLRPVAAGAPEIFAEDDPPRRLTRNGSAWQRPLTGLANEQIDVPGPGGPIRTTVLSPRVAGRRALPTVLSVIGGPGGTWGPFPWLPDLALADHGYRVLAPDPRGSESYGREWLAAIGGAWGGADADDQLAVVDWAVDRGLVDRRRLAVTGLSYGGFMTQWLIGQTDRFAAAVAINGVANQVSSVGNCDLGTLWTPRLGWDLLPGSFETLWKQSPLAYADRIATPLLMLQGEADLRCPAADNEQLFAALRALGREVEYVLYPEESHLMQATGRPDRRIDMLERMVAWLDRHLKP